MNKIIGLELKSVCNLKCKMCPCVGRFTGEELPRDVVRQIYKDVASYNSQTDMKSKGIHTLRFDGNNEPLLIDGVCSFIEEAKLLNPDVCMYLVTNGILLSSEMTDNLIKSGVNKVHISITGCTAGVYKHFQGHDLPDDKLEANFALVNANARHFIKEAIAASPSPEVVMSYIVNEYSYDEIPEYTTYWTSLGASLDVRSIGGSSRFITGGFIGYKQCKLIGHMLIKANGDLLLSCCGNVNVPVVGNVFKDSLYSILTSAEFVELEEAFAKMDVESLPDVCVNCSSMHSFRSDMSSYMEEYAQAEKDYGVFDNKGFKNNTLTDFYRQLKGRQLVLFGAGMGVHDALCFIDERIPISAVMDNDKNKHGTAAAGVAVRPVAEVLSNDCENKVILLTMYDLKDAVEQLESFGGSRIFSATMFFERGSADGL